MGIEQLAYGDRSDHFEYVAKPINLMFAYTRLALIR